MGVGRSSHTWLEAMSVSQRWLVLADWAVFGFGFGVCEWAMTGLLGVYSGDGPLFVLGRGSTARRVRRSS
jgi:hypothetical protein